MKSRYMSRVRPRGKGEIEMGKIVTSGFGCDDAIDKIMAREKEMKEMFKFGDRVKIIDDGQVGTCGQGGQAGRIVGQSLNPITKRTVTGYWVVKMANSKRMAFHYSLLIKVER